MERWNDEIWTKTAKTIITYYLERSEVMGIKTGPKRIAKSTGKPDRRQHDNKNTPGNTPTLKPHQHKKGD